MIALIDADIIAYKAGAIADTRCYQYVIDDEVVYDMGPCYKKDADRVVEEVGLCGGQLELYLEPEPLKNALHLVKQMIEGIIKATECSEYYLYLTKSNDEEAFRNKVATIFPYKGNRWSLEKWQQVRDEGKFPLWYSSRKLPPTPTPRPTYYKEIREYMLKHHPCREVAYIEADDYLTMLQSNKKNTIACTIDKDNLQVAGLKYHFETKEIYEITEEEAIKNLYQQIIEGDNADNIPGLKFFMRPRVCGPKKLEEFFKINKTEKEIKAGIEYLWYTYSKEDYRPKFKEIVNEVGQLVYLWRCKNDHFNWDKGVTRTTRR